MVKQNTGIALPIHTVLENVHTVLSCSHQLVLQAEPGAGKSTALPLSLLEADWLQGQKIVMLEPRRVAAKSIAHFLAKQLGEVVGQRVGYHIKNDKKVSEETRFEIVTEGILTRRLQADPELNGTGLIIFDEFHERSLNSDLALLLSLEVQQTLREDLKLLVMSATIDTAQIAEYLGQADVIRCPGRTYPVEVTHLAVNQLPAKSAPRGQPSFISSLVSTLKTASTSSAGDILVFLPGQGDIIRSIEVAQAHFLDDEWRCLPLYGALPLAQQEQALLPDPQGKRRIVFATNIAETSLTIEGITTVIDSGLEKTLVYDPASGMTRLQTQFISRASADQRAGRAGRTQSGQCYRLWSQEQHRTLNAFQPEEILTADLTGLRMELAEWGATDVDTLHWLTPPPKANVESASDILVMLGLLDDSGQLTPFGRQAGTLGVSPRLAAMLLKVQQSEDTSEAQQALACDLASVLGERDIFYGACGADLLDRLMALQDYQHHKKQALQQYPLKRAAAEQCLQTASSYRRRLKLNNRYSPLPLADLQIWVGKLLLNAFPDRLAKQRVKDGGRYRLSNGRGVFLSEQESLYGSEWLIVADADGQKKEGRIFQAVALNQETVWDVLQDKVQEKHQFVLDAEKEKFTAEKHIIFGVITLKSSIITQIPPDTFLACVRQSISESGFQLFQWSKACDDWLARVTWLGQYLEDFPVLSKASLQNSVEDWLLPYLAGAQSVAALKKVDLLPLLNSQLSWEAQTQLDQEAPTSYTAPSGRRVPIVYHSQQGPMVSIPLQDMFGQITSPCLAMGKVALRFELLSPAKRPLQTTSDLANFWQTSYFDVAKEMRGRYPKHRWPEEPLKEQPGRSIKRRPA